MNRKLVTGTGLLKAGGEGLATAIFSRFGGPPDHDGDITLPGAFTDGAQVVVSPWNHSSTASALPAGKGVIRVKRDRAEVDVEFFMDTTAGRDTYLTLRALGGSEWSYAYDVEDAEAGTWQGRTVRVLKRLRVYETSPVMRGAGRDTETLSLRSDPAVRRVLDEARNHVAEQLHQGELTRAELRLIAAGLEG